MIDETLKQATLIARLALDFGRVDRATRHPDGYLESDTDHTVMLGWLAIELCPTELDRGLVARMALVHDMVEVITGDVNTLGISREERAAKADRERRAMGVLRDRLGADSPLGGDLEAYEMMDLPEARFVKLLDKVAPKLTHRMNGCAAAKATVNFSEFTAAHAEQYKDLAAQYPEPVFKPVLDLLATSMVAAEAAWHSETPEPSSSMQATSPLSLADLIAQVHDLQARVKELEDAIPPGLAVSPLVVKRQPMYGVGLDTLTRMWSISGPGLDPSKRYNSAGDALRAYIAFRDGAKAKP